MWTDTLEIGQLEKSSAAQISKLIGRAVTENRAHILQKDEIYAVHGDSDKPADFETQIKDGNWTLNLNGTPVKKEYVDGLKRFRFSGEAKTYTISPVQTRKVL